MTAPLEPAYRGAALPLARLAPRGEPLCWGLRQSFADLPRLADHLAGEGVDGYLAVLDEGGRPTALALLFEGRLVAACAAAESGGRGPAEGGTVWADAALGELARQYAGGAVLAVARLERAFVHALAGVGERPWRVQPGESFTGTRVTADGEALLYASGSVVARVEADHPQAGAFPAPLRPATLALPRVLGPWAGERYALSLRGRDAVNPITDVHVRARATHGRAALDLLAALGRGQTPLEAAADLGRDVAELEGAVESFLREGLLRRAPAG